MVAWTAYIMITPIMISLSVTWWHPSEPEADGYTQRGKVCKFSDGMCLSVNMYMYTYINIVEFYGAHTSMKY